MTNTKFPIKSMSEWDFEQIEELFHIIEDIAVTKYGLDTYPNQIEIITSEQMLDAYCVTPDHKVLRSDLHWIPAGKVVEGDIILGFDEHGPHRSFRKARATRVEHTTDQVFSVELSSGQIFKVTKDHLWLVRQQKGQTSTLLWKKTSQLRGENDPSGHSPSRIPKVIDTWTENKSFDAGWIAGMYDGEGNIVNNSVSVLSISQREGLVLDKLKTILTEQDIPFNVYDKHDSDCKTLNILGQVRDKLKFMGSYRSERLISKLDFDSLGLMKTPNWEEVISITPIGEHPIVKITTDTGTFVCDGYPMHNCSVGMPIMYSHWSFGKQFVNEQEMYRHGLKGLAYEIVINSNPCISYLMEENSLTMQALVMAHAAFGHNHFFKNNYLFKQWTDAEGIIDYLVFAKKFIADCEEKYGPEEVEAVLDSCHALQQYGIDKYKRPPRLSKAETKERQRERAEYTRQQLDVIWSTIPERVDDESVGERKDIFPSEPQENILYFIEKNAPNLESWKREIIRIVRKIAQYFYPQGLTKTMNEGTATYFHYKIMHDLYDRGILDDGCMLEFYDSHSSVVYQPSYHQSSMLNPYALGWAIFKDIERIATEPTEEDREWFRDQEWVGSGKWLETIKWAIANFKDESFIQQFLSPKVIRDFRLFAFRDDENEDEFLITAIHNKQGYKEIIKTLAEQYTHSFFTPDIQVVKVDKWGDRSMTLMHTMKNGMPLEPNDTLMTLKHLQSLWGYGVRLESVNKEINDLAATFEVDKNGETIMDVFLSE